MHCAIWYHLYKLKNVKNTHGGVFFKLYKWHQIEQRTTYLSLTLTNRNTLAQAKTEMT